MIALNFTVIKLTLCLILGILVGYFYPFECTTLILITIFLLTGLFIFHLMSNKPFKTTFWFGCFSYMAFIVIGMLTVFSHDQKQFTNHYSHHIEPTENVHAALTFTIHEALKSSTSYDRYVIRTSRINAKTVNGKLLLHIKKDTLSHPLNVDEQYRAMVQIKAVTPPLNPNQFDYKAYLARQYIYHQIFTESQKLVNVKPGGHSIFGLADMVRRYLNSKLNHYHFKPDERAIINALLLGQRQYISDDVYSHYAHAGVIHILAVSGLHIGILLLIFSYILNPLERLKYGKTIKVVLLLGLLWSFAIITGLSASVTRAVTMFSLVAIASNLKRPTNIYNTLTVSMFILLLWKPMALFDVGFQLSYLAVFSIVSLDPMFYKLFQSKYWIVDKLWHTFTITMAAQLGILPVSLYYFHQFPGLFFMSNLVIVPVLGLILGLGLLTMALSIFNALPHGLAHGYGSIISTMNDFVDWIAKQDSFLFTDIPFNGLYVLASYFFITALVCFRFKSLYFCLKMILCGLLFTQIAVMITAYRAPHNTLIIFNKSRYTLIGHVTANHMKVAQNLNQGHSASIKTIKDYALGNHIKTIENESLKSVYVLDKTSLLIVDSLCVYNVKSFRPDYVLLRGSPKLNVNRLIDSLRPKLIIADGSNFKSYVLQWKSVCEQRKLPFHYTGERGAFIINY
ncbi:ComEC/Rec2 family competence protein [Aestuariivivens sediminis]|uniref:ComEC/Rec2 family competence protein n=1 Tax=Aestuariivivens sediminis TaxID=2913557 RepID=UPI001F56CA55|nr:ComEC/Rec2 family competence protein [Aestuariivivens sediminis]